MAVKNDLIAKIQAHEARVGIVGLGYVGLPLVLRFGEEHFPVLGFDVDPAKVRKLQAGESYIRHIPADRFRVLIKEKQFEPTADFQRLAEADCIIICVPTPLTPKKDPDLQYIENTADAISRTLRKGQLVCLESTTYPGTTEEILLERFRATGLQAGSYRRGQHEALWLHTFLSRSRSGRALHTNRSLLSFVESEGIRFFNAVYSTGR